uniref:Uncharacterized protein n=1 Tax=Nelumbo nucifera TaxID=4432 RepID=A0A822YFA9_NELNU|nr:TPA_asm: hypothetical protein HUJ06_010028 [Nelumbo nucifera]
MEFGVPILEDFVLELFNYQVNFVVFCNILSSVKLVYCYPSKKLLSFAVKKEKLGRS